jgi:hypothetical protein
MHDLFISQIADKLAETDLQLARDYLVHSLSKFTAIPLALCGKAETIHCTDVCSVIRKVTPFELSWQGFIGSSSYRNDGMLVFGAHLFPFIGGTRSCVVRIEDGKPTYDFAFRYLMLTPENGWEDRGWQVDEYGEFEHWYPDIGR